jgi:type IX secretion system PorP/SprF family membrane protein
MKGREAFMKNYFCFFILFILVNLAAQAQQEPLFSNYMLMRSVTNRGFVGADKAINAVFCNRTMFAGFNNNTEGESGIPVTSVFGVEAPVEIFGKQSGVGILMVNDKIGFLQDVKVDFTYAYHHRLENGTLGFGLSLGFNNYSLTPDWFIPSTDPGFYEDWAETGGDSYIPPKFSTIVFGLGLSTYYQTPQYYLGLSASNINRGDISNVDQAGEEFVYAYYAANFNLSGAYNIELPDPLFDLQPSFVLRTDLAGYMLDLNATIFYKQRHWAGFGLRLSPGNIGSFTLLGGTELVNGLNVGYAFDLNTSYLIYGGATSHEIIVTYSFNIDKKRDMKYKSVRYL